MPVIKGLLKGDVIFTNLEAAVAEPGETIQEGRGFLTPPAALDALTLAGFNLLALSGNHAFDLRATVEAHLPRRNLIALDDEQERSTKRPTIGNELFGGPTHRINNNRQDCIAIRRGRVCEGGKWNRAIARRRCKNVREGIVGHNG